MKKDLWSDSMYQTTTKARKAFQRSKKSLKKLSNEARQYLLGRHREMATEEDEARIAAIRASDTDLVRMWYWNV